MMKGGLYEVIDEPGACVTYRLLYDDDTLGQIVASSQFDPIEVIGVSTTTIHGYYPNPSSPGDTWLRKATVWGDATDGSLTAEPVENGEVALVSGLSSNGRVSICDLGLCFFQFQTKKSIQTTSSSSTCGAISTTSTTQSMMTLNAQLVLRKSAIGQVFSPVLVVSTAQSRATIN